MTVFSIEDIDKLHQTNLGQAVTKLKEIDVCCGVDPKFAGLNGWVFEQTIRYCIQKELEAKNISLKISEQVSLCGRAKADLLVGNTAIEIKTSGLFGMNGVERYKRYHSQAIEKGFNRYLYLTWEESHVKYRSGLDNALGKENVFYICDNGEWKRFIDVILSANSK